MTKSNTKITLSRSADIPFEKLRLSQSNVRRIKAGVAIEELAADIARRTLLQSITVRAILDDAGQETGLYDVPGGGRRFRALELLVKQKRLAKTAPIPCVIRTEGLAEEDSLAENVQRAPLHALDQFRAFQAMRENGMGEDEIATAFFTTTTVVRQRLRLTACSQVLLDAYAEDQLTLDQLMAFTVNPDHQRQNQVYETLGKSYQCQPYQIRRMLTETAVRASDKRAQFVGPDNYEEAGGSILRDLFQADEGGWLQDVGLLDTMVSERLREEADRIAVEGWRWVETMPEMPYGITYGMRRLNGERTTATDDQVAQADAMEAEMEQLEAEYAASEDLPAEVETRLRELNAAIDAINNPTVTYSAEDRALAGVFVSIGSSGEPRVDPGYVRAQDEPKTEVAEPVMGSYAAGNDNGDIDARVGDSNEDGDISPSLPPEEEDEPGKPISDRLVSELTAFRTVALREALGRHPDTAFLACLHAFVCKLFLHYSQDSCLDVAITSTSFGASANPGLAEAAAAVELDTRHRAWGERLRGDGAQLWEELTSFDHAERMELFAHCVSMGVNALVEPWNKRPRAIAHAGELAHAVDLNLARDWQPTADNYLGRVTKARIVDAVREARGPAAAERLAGLKKGEMAERAETMLAGTGWLPEPLRSLGYALAPMHEGISLDAHDVVGDTTIDVPVGDIGQFEDEMTDSEAEEELLAA